MIRILVCDDEEAFLQRFCQRLEALCAGEKERIQIDAVQDPRRLTESDLRQIDIAFLDVDLGQTNGLELARRFRTVCRDTLLIFVTNYMEYAAEGYEVAAFRYLPKDALDAKLPDYFAQALEACQKQRGQMLFLCEKEEVLVPLDCLVYAETWLRGVTLHLHGFSRETLHSRRPMVELEKRLAERAFLRVHQSYLVNMAYIQRLQSNGTWLTTGQKLPTSARNYHALKHRYLGWKGASACPMR